MSSPTKSRKWKKLEIFILPFPAIHHETFHAGCSQIKLANIGTYVVQKIYLLKFEHCSALRVQHPWESVIGYMPIKTASQHKNGLPWDKKYLLNRLMFRYISSMSFVGILEAPKAVKECINFLDNGQRLNLNVHDNIYLSKYWKDVLPPHIDHME